MSLKKFIELTNLPKDLIIKMKVVIINVRLVVMLVS